MLRHLLLAFAGCWLAGSPLLGGQLKLQLEDLAARAPAGSTCQVRLTPIKGHAADTREVMIRDALCYGASTLNLADGPWWLSIESPHMWAEPQIITLSAQPASARLKLLAAGWVRGRVEAQDQSPLRPEARVELLPAGLASPLPGEVAPRGGIAAETSTINDRGFFIFEGIAPGEYALVARQPPLGEARAEVQVLADLEAELREPLVLAPPERLGVEVHPPLSPDGSPWRAVLERLDRRPHRGAVVADELLPMDGYWWREGLARGRYRFTLRGPHGDSWLSREVELGAEPMPLSLEITAVPVEGKVWLGDEPLTAEIWFGTRFGAEKVRLASDEDGAFRGLLPRAGRWAVEVSAPAPPLHQTVPGVEVSRPDNGGPARAEIRLPDTLLEVEVVDRQGAPVRGARVEALRVDDPDTEAASPETSDSAGRLQLWGLPTGRYSLSARTPDGRESDALALTLVERRELPPVTLVVEARLRLRLTVLGPESGIAGAKVMVFPESEVASVPILFTDGAGEVEVQLPGATTQLRYLIEAPGVAPSFGGASVPAERELRLSVQREGGELVLGLPHELGREYPFVPLLFHHGSRLSWSGVARLAGAEVSRGELRLPNAEPGAYQLCWGDRAGAMVGPCTQGRLSPLGDLELRLSASP